MLVFPLFSMLFSGTVTPAEIEYMLQVLPCVNFVDKSPQRNPAQCLLLLHILYTALINSRHKWTAPDPNLGTPAAERLTVRSALLFAACVVLACVRGLRFFACACAFGVFLLAASRGTATHTASQS